MIKYPKVEKPIALLDEYYKVRSDRAISSIEEFPNEHLWKLEEVKETLFEFFGKSMQYWLVSSWVNGGYITPQCPKEWQILKERKRTHDGRYPNRPRRKKWSDFDIMIRTSNGMPVFVKDTSALNSSNKNYANKERFMGWKTSISTKSGLVIDIYPEKTDEMETAILINPEYEDFVNSYIPNKEKVDRYE